MKLNIAEVGNFFKSSNRIDYIGDDNLLQYDLLLVNFDWIFEPAKPLDNGDLKKYEKRIEELKEFIKIKKIPIVYFSCPTRPLSKIDRRGGTITAVAQSYSSVAPIDNIKFENRIGSNTTVQQGTPFTEFFKKYQSAFHYKSWIKNHSGTCLLTVEHTDKCLAYYKETELFLPLPNRGNLKNEEEFLEDLYTCLLQLNGKKEALPEWCRNFLLPGEEKSRQELAGLEEQLQQLKDTITFKEREIEKITSKKVLLSLDGTTLEQEVEILFKELDISVETKKNNREDLIIEHNGKYAVVEIKGLKGSAAEKNSAQLEKWVAEFLEEKNLVPKGILIANTFKETPLNDRAKLTTPNFPDQMLKYSKKRGHCLITGLSLLCYYFDVKSGQLTKEAFMDLLFDTEGVLEYKDWKKHIAETGSQETHRV